jgi:hypothetical protein
LAQTIYLKMCILLIKGTIIDKKREALAIEEGAKR